MERQRRWRQETLLAVMLPPDFLVYLFYGIAGCAAPAPSCRADGRRAALIFACRADPSGSQVRLTQTIRSVSEATSGRCATLIRVTASCCKLRLTSASLSRSR